jgi:hypothetical protein
VNSNEWLEINLGHLRNIRFDSLNNLRARYTATAMLKWQTDTDFDKGSHSGTEASGSGDAAVLQLEDEIDLDDDFDYETAGEYTLSDSAKLEILGGSAALKAVSGDTNDWPFTTPGNYIYDSAKIDVAGGIATLKGLTGVYAHWHLNESSGTNVADAGPNGYDGTTQNMEDVDWIAAKLNNGLRFDGSNEYVDCGGIAQFERTDTFSFEGWIKTSTASKIVMASHNGTRGWMIYIAGSGKLFVALDNATSGNRITRYSGAAVTSGAWVHFVATYDGSSTLAGLNIYINGSLDNGTGTDALSATIVSGSSMTLGRRADGLYFNGDMDEVVIYNKELTSAEVTARYNSGSGTEKEGVDQNNPTIYPTSGFVFTIALSAFTETATKPSGTEVKYHVSSDDGVTWKYWTGAAWAVTDDSYAQANTAADVNTNIGSLASSGTFRFRALLNSDGSNNVQLDNIYVSEPITYSTTDNLYIDTKAASQIDATDVLAWLTTTFTETLPANTDIRVLFSIDGRSSWLTWSGSAWVAPASATTRTDATSITDAEANFSDLAVGSNTLDVRIFLYTSDSSARPVVSNINATGDKGYKTSGSWESNVYNSNQLSEDWLNVAFLLTTPGGTSITIQVRAANTEAEVAAASYGSALSSGEDAGVTGRYIQFKVTFTGTGLARASLDWLAVTWETMDLPEIAP